MVTKGFTGGSDVGDCGWARCHEWDWCWYLQVDGQDAIICGSGAGAWVFGEVGCSLCSPSPIKELPGKRDLSWYCTVHFWRKVMQVKWNCLSVSLQCVSYHFCVPFWYNLSPGFQCSYERISVHIWLSKWYFYGSIEPGNLHPSILMTSLYFVLFSYCQIVFNICMLLFHPNPYFSLDFIVKYNYCASSFLLAKFLQ